MGIETAIFAGLTVATTVAGANAAKTAAQRQNDAIDRSQTSLRESTIATQNQLTEAAALERRKVMLNAAQIEGRIRASRATAGQGMAGSTLALLRQNNITGVENQGIIDTNLSNQIARVRSGHDANAANLNAGLVDTGMATLTGGLSGLNSGLGIFNGISQFRTLLNPRQPERASTQPVSIL